MWQLVTAAPPSESHLKCNLCKYLHLLLLNQTVYWSDLITHLLKMPIKSIDHRLQHHYSNQPT